MDLYWLSCTLERDTHTRRNCVRITTTQQQQQQQQQHNNNTQNGPRAEDHRRDTCLYKGML